jgi:hypothetical protein
VTTVADIKQAKAVHTHHLATHRCGALTRCPERAELWKAYMATADHWGADPDDDQRQRDDFNRSQVRPPA